MERVDRAYGTNRVIMVVAEDKEVLQEYIERLEEVFAYLTGEGHRNLSALIRVINMDTLGKMFIPAYAINNRDGEVLSMGIINIQDMIVCGQEETAEKFQLLHSLVDDAEFQSMTTDQKAQMIENFLANEATKGYVRLIEDPEKESRVFEMISSFYHFIQGGYDAANKMAYHPETDRKEEVSLGTIRIVLDERGVPVAEGVPDGCSVNVEAYVMKVGEDGKLIPLEDGEELPFEMPSEIIKPKGLLN